MAATHFGLLMLAHQQAKKGVTKLQLTNYYKRAGLLLHDKGKKNMSGIKEIHQGISWCFQAQF